LPSCSYQLRVLLRGFRTHLSRQPLSKPQAQLAIVVASLMAASLAAASCSPTIPFPNGVSWWSSCAACAWWSLLPSRSHALRQKGNHQLACKRAQLCAHSCSPETGASLLVRLLKQRLVAGSNIFPVLIIKMVSVVARCCLAYYCPPHHCQVLFLSPWR
jgi:hypothetical protein